MTMADLPLPGPAPWPPIPLCPLLPPMPTPPSPPRQVTERTHQWLLSRIHPEPGEAHSKTLSVTQNPWGHEVPGLQENVDPVRCRETGRNSHRGDSVTWTPLFSGHGGGDPADRPRSRPRGMLPLCALAESPVAGGVAGLSTLKLLRKSRYFSLPLELTGISSQSLSNWQGSEVTLGSAHTLGKRARSQRRQCAPLLGPGLTSS